MKVSGAEKTESVMKRIQDLIYRNSQPQNKTSSGHQFRLQQVFNIYFFIFTNTYLIQIILQLVKSWVNEYIFCDKYSNVITDMLWSFYYRTRWENNVATLWKSFWAIVTNRFLLEFHTYQSQFSLIRV